MILRKDCKCPCHRAGHAIIHVMPCCGRNGPGSASMPRKPFRKSKKEKSSLSSPIKKPTTHTAKLPAATQPSQCLAAVKADPDAGAYTVLHAGKYTLRIWHAG
jgi:hypothetical protein